MGCPVLPPVAAAECLLGGGVLACPTEGVWGLGCVHDDETAVARVIALKQRSSNKGLILIGASRAMLQPLLAPLEPAWRSRMDVAWPGPVTFIVPAARNVSALLSGGRTTLAVRVSAHPALMQLVTLVGKPIVSTSANLSGEKTLKSAAAIRRTFGDTLDGIVDGEPGSRRGPSDIIDVRTGERLR